MKTILLILISFSISAQKLTSEQKYNLDHTADYYSRAALSWGVAEIAYHYTHRKFMSAVIGIGAGLSTVMLERGTYGRLVSIGGSLSGPMCFAIRWDIKERNRQELLEKRRKVEQIKEQFDNL